MRRFLPMPFFALFLLALSSPALAGPGTNLNACFKFQETPRVKCAECWVVEFKANVQGTCIKTPGPTFAGDSNFTDAPNPQKTSEPDARVHCVSLGYYEADNSSCTVTLGYRVPGTSYAGSIDLTWWSDDYNHLSGGNAKDTTVVCGSGKVCSSQEYNWDTGTVGDAYVIFQPE